jgi:hypothetical protein
MEARPLFKVSQSTFRRGQLRDDGFGMHCQQQLSTPIVVSWAAISQSTYMHTLFIVEAAGEEN